MKKLVLRVHTQRVLMEGLYHRALMGFNILQLMFLILAVLKPDSTTFTDNVPFIINTVMGLMLIMPKFSFMLVTMISGMNQASLLLHLFGFTGGGHRTGHAAGGTGSAGRTASGQHPQSQNACKEHQFLVVRHINTFFPLQSCKALIIP